MGRNARAARTARTQRRRRTMIAAAATVVVVAVFAVIVLALRENPAGQADSGAGGTASGAVGTVFPDFTLTGADGTPITRATLAGKKTLIWFTDSSCPDPDGLTRTAGLDDELGGQAFTVLAVLVNLRAPSPIQAEWRDAFGRPDWLVAPDENGALSAKVGVRALETKFLLDEHSRVLDISTDLVTDDYLTALRKQVQV